MTINLHLGPNARYNEYPVLDTLLDLGIIPKSPNGRLEGSLGGPVLDVGCGENGNLVHHLNLSGLNAEGIDPNLSDTLSSEQFIKGKANNIPRPDDYYGSAVSNMSLYQDGMYFPFVFLSETGMEFPDFLQIYNQEFKPELMSSLYEIRRVLKPGSQFTIYPFPTVWISDVAQNLKSEGYKFSEEKVFGKVLPPPFDEVGKEYKSRLILEMPTI